MRIVLAILCILYALMSLFAISTMNQQIEALQKITNKQSKVIKWQSENIERLKQETRACDRLIQEVGLSMNKRFQSHKNWTYQNVSDLAQQMTDLSDLVRGSTPMTITVTSDPTKLIEGITNDTDTEETEEENPTE